MATGAEKEGTKGRMNLDRLLLDTVKVVTKHPPHTLTYSKLSRFLKVPRSTLYYYFGKDVYNLLNEATRFAMKKFTVLDKMQEYRTFPNWQNYHAARFRRVVEIVQKNPWAPRLYFRYRDDQSSIGNAVRKAEKEYLAFSKEVWMHFHNGKAPSEDFEGLAAALKLGFLWGISLDVSPGLANPGSASPVADKLISRITALMEEFLKD